MHAGHLTEDLSQVDPCLTKKCSSFKWPLQKRYWSAFAAPVFGGSSPALPMGVAAACSIVTNCNVAACPRVHLALDLSMNRLITSTSSHGKRLLLPLRLWWSDARAMYALIAQ
jgi:hypothetical protein